MTIAPASASPDGNAGNDAADEAAGVARRHATATARNDPTFPKPHSCVLRAPERTPTPCNAVHTMVTVTATSVPEVASDGHSAPVSSPRAMAPAAIDAALEIQSLHPMTKPAYSPMARRAYTYWPPDFGSIAASSAIVIAPHRA